MSSSVNIPKVSLRKRENKKKGTWSYHIRFTVNYKGYEATITIPNCPDDIACGIQAQTTSALAGRGDFPKEIADAPAIKEYLKNVGLTISSDAPPIPDLNRKIREKPAITHARRYSSENEYQTRQGTIGKNKRIRRNYPSIRLGLPRRDALRRRG